MATATLPSALETARHHHAQNHLLEAAESYRQTLQSNPRSRDALLGLSLIARQSNQIQPAFRMALASLACAPDSALAWANFGDLLLAVRRIPQARSAFRRSLGLDCSVAAAHYGLANTHALQEDFALALPSFQTAVELAPNLPEFHFALAFALGKLGRHNEAVLAYRQSVTLRPSFTSAWLNLGVELIADGRDDLAELCYREALAAESPNTRISALLNLGHLHRSRRHFPLASEVYEQACQLAIGAFQTRQAEVQISFTYLHLEQKQFEEAWQSLLRAESADPKRENSEIPNARGILLLAQQSQERVPQVSNLRPGSDAGPELILKSPLEAAIAAFQQAESQGHKTAASNRGNALLRLGHCEEALQVHEHALQLDPHHPGVRYNLALTQLRLGDFARGWPNYEIRWQFREVHAHPRRFQQPRWQGEGLAAQAILFLYAEQGLGDTLQFCRYLYLVADRLPDSRLILEVQPPLTRLLTPFLQELSNTSPGITAQILPQGDPLPPFTHHCPLMSLPAVFQATVETIPAPIPYLRADPELTAQRARELAAIAPSDTPAIGIAWAGNPNYRADHERSTNLATFLPLLQTPAVRWISLQKGDPAAQISQISPPFAPLDASSSDQDLAATTALIANLDLVITTDTVIAHLAGALGKPLWLLLPWQSDWRWMQDRLTSPWYPAARLFRQSSPDNWPELIGRVATELRLWIKDHSADHVPGLAPTAL